MKKYLTIIILILLISVIITTAIMMNRENTVIAVRTVEYLDNTYEERVDVKLKKGKVSNIELIKTFEKAELAEIKLAEIQFIKKLSSAETNNDIRQIDNKIVSKIEIETLKKKMKVEDKEITKEDIVNFLKEKGYTVK